MPRRSASAIGENTFFMSATLGRPRRTAAATRKAYKLQVLRSGLKRVVPAEAWEAGEVAVVGMDDSAVFHRDGSDGSIGDEVAGGAGFNSKLFEEAPITVARMKDTDVWKGEPRVDDLGGLPEGGGSGVDTRVGHEAQKGVDGKNWKPDRFR